MTEVKLIQKIMTGLKRFPKNYERTETKLSELCLVLVLLAPTGTISGIAYTRKYKIYPLSCRSYDKSETKFSKL